MREILGEFYKKIFRENDAELARALGVSSSTPKRYREDTTIPAWVLLYIWQNAPSLLRDRIIDLEIAKDPCVDLSEEEGALVRDFAEMLKTRRSGPVKRSARSLNDTELSPTEEESDAMVKDFAIRSSDASIFPKNDAAPTRKTEKKVARAHKPRAAKKHQHR